MINVLVLCGETRKGWPSGIKKIVEDIDWPSRAEASRTTREIKKKITYNQVESRELRGRGAR